MNAPSLYAHPLSTATRAGSGPVATMRNRKKKAKVPAGYDSKLEYDLHNNELKGFIHHPEERISYVSRHTYEPDFVTEICLEKDCKCAKNRRCGRSKTILVEVKGRFRERKEASKYIAVREACNKDEKEVVFLFQDAGKPMPNAQRRKDGTKQSHGEWAEKNGFTYFCLKRGLPERWLTSLT